LIVGNGISRLTPEISHFIEDWDGEEFWICNNAYKEFGMLATMWHGHYELMDEVVNYIHSNNSPMKIYGSKAPLSLRFNSTCPNKYRRDSGTSLVAEAFTRNYDVYCAGFDMGGPDIYGWMMRGSTSWLKRWKEIYNAYRKQVVFIGQDHNPVIMNSHRHGEYQSKFLHGKPHINTPGYATLFWSHYLEAREKHKYSLATQAPVEVNSKQRQRIVRQDKRTKEKVIPGPRKGLKFMRVRRPIA
jgi:hypothetical protein